MPEHIEYILIDAFTLYGLCAQGAITQQQLSGLSLPTNICGNTSSLTSFLNNYWNYVYSYDNSDGSLSKSNFPIAHLINS